MPSFALTAAVRKVKFISSTFFLLAILKGILNITSFHDVVVNCTIINTTEKRDAIAPAFSSISNQDSPQFHRSLGSGDIADLKSITSTMEFTSENTKFQLFYRVYTVDNLAWQSKGDILLLHGKAFDSSVWIKTNTLHALVRRGYRAVAIDIPGFGQSRILNHGDVHSLILIQVISILNLNRPIIVAPSMSGKYAISLLLHDPAVTRGYVTIAPVLPKSFSDATLLPTNLPVLVIWGSKDKPGKQRSKKLMRIPKATGFEIAGGSHPCYLDFPDIFNTKLCDWIDSIS